VLTLYQAEWCPYSSAARELLTELGLPFVAIPVEPLPEERATLRKRFGTDEIPVLATDDGGVHRGTEAILAYLTTLPPSPFARGHREQFAKHRHARETDATAKILADAVPPEVEVRDNTGESRYELVRDGDVIGHATYRLEDGRVVVPYVEVEPRFEGLGYGSVLCAGLLANARPRGLEVVALCPFLAWYMERFPSVQG
jgi:glutathione S-transferase